MNLKHNSSPNSKIPNTLKFLMNGWIKNTAALPHFPILDKSRKLRRFYFNTEKKVRKRRENCVQKRNGQKNNKTKRTS